jgi:hypothetical protein
VNNAALMTMRKARQDLADAISNVEVPIWKTMLIDKIQKNWRLCSL